MNELKIKRIYLPYNEDDGFRILIDRLWPRGISKVNASINEHCKYIAPSTEIRKAFGHKEEEYNLKSATIIQYTIKGRFMSR